MQRLEVVIRCEGVLRLTCLGRMIIMVLNLSFPIDLAELMSTRVLYLRRLDSWLALRRFSAFGSAEKTADWSGLSTREGVTIVM